MLHSYYAIQITTYPIIDASQVSNSEVIDITSSVYGYTVPSNFPYATNSSSRFCPQLNIITTNFGNLFGFSTGYFPTENNKTDIQVMLSSFTPQISPISSLLVTCDLVNNPVASPSTLIYSFSSGSTSFGSMISSSPSGQLPFVDILDGTYTEFKVKFYDQAKNRIKIQDPNLVIMLVIRNKSER